MKSLILLMAIALLFQSNLVAQASSLTAEEPYLISTVRFERATTIQDIVPPLRGVDVDSFELSIKVVNTTQLTVYQVSGSSLSQGVRTKLSSLPAGSEVWIDNIVYRTPQPNLKQHYALKVRD